ncbi:flavohemoprotein [Diplodia corticola]|uniref:nitric oxide dioxygenase n=1 Tax=Diplodia corticola TaxID=236234 RepID=A0A1J9SLM8_9PEZI|nr:flavohemoprotein [Diplodia corticola]OJD40517.1 flavohemoprotein [Diplodia corticola]
MPLTPEQAKIIKATVPILAQHGNTITTRFYANVLRENPDLNNIFSNTHQVTGHQPRALAMSLYAYASNIDDLGVLSPAVELICQKHASLYIQPEHYSVVGTYLLAAMKEILGDALTPDIHDAWAAAYWQLADIMIGKEAELYKQADGWTDWRDFRIARKEPESSEITSFYLAPVDGKPLPAFLPGQYISIQAHVAGLEFKQARQYSLSDAPNAAHYRISVKREPGVDGVAHPGYVSNVLHADKREGDVLRVSHPYGDFFCDAAALPAADSPVVLLAAGVGLTALMSILNTLTSSTSTTDQPSRPRRPISWIHAARTTRARAFAPHVRRLAAANPNLRAVSFVSRPDEAADVPGRDYDAVGRLELGRLDAERDLFVADGRTRYYVCGPERFMVDMQKGLRALGVDEERVHLELFGTGGVSKA